MNPNDHKTTPEEAKKIEEAKARFEKELDTEYSVKLQKRELLVLFNLMTTIAFKYGDFVILDKIIKKIQPIIAVDSSKKEEIMPIIGAKN